MGLAWGFRITRNEERIEKLLYDVGHIQHSMHGLDMADHVKKLLDQLHGVAPKVISQDEAVKKIRDRLTKLEEETLPQRITQVEREVRRLVSEVEGADDAPSEGEPEAARIRSKR